MSRVRATVVIAGEFIAFAPIVEAGSIDFARPKSSDFHRAVKSHLDVRGLQIPMDDPMPVRHFERVRELLRDQERLLNIRLPSRAVTLDAFLAGRGRSFARVRAEL